MKKFGVAFALTAILSGSFALTAFAGSWLTAKDGWWYRYDDGSYPVSQWVWLDGNNDGVYECYYFNQGGYLLTNTHTPDGYYVDANGAWVADGVVQAKGQKKQSGGFRQNWIYGTYEIHAAIDGEMEVGYYSDVDETDYVRIEGANSSLGSLRELSSIKMAINILPPMMKVFLSSLLTMATASMLQIMAGHLDGLV